MNWSGFKKAIEEKPIEALALVVSIVAIGLAMRSDKIAQDANDAAVTANEIAKEAYDAAVTANEIAKRAYDATFGEALAIRWVKPDPSNTTEVSDGKYGCNYLIELANDGQVSVGIAAYTVTVRYKDQEVHLSPQTYADPAMVSTEASLEISATAVITEIKNWLLDKTYDGPVGYPPGIGTYYDLSESIPGRSYPELHSHFAYSIKGPVPADLSRDKMAPGYDPLNVDYAFQLKSGEIITAPNSVPCFHHRTP